MRRGPSPFSRLSTFGPMACSRIPASLLLRPAGELPRDSRTSTEHLECQGGPGDLVPTAFLGNIFFFTFSDAVTRETHRFARPSSLLARSRNGISARGMSRSSSDDPNTPAGTSPIYQSPLRV